ncbi:hypothetical protein ACS0TY_025955 [Phlomoides rotata]
MLLSVTWPLGSKSTLQTFKLSYHLFFLCLTCRGCNVVSQCCNSYEFCVSCCLNPDMTRKGLALKVKIAKPMSAGTYGSVFDYCAGRCRHNSESVVHENAYLSEFHHCFSIPSNSSGQCIIVLFIDNSHLPLWKS